MSFPLTIEMAIVCRKKLGDNPPRKRELAINYPSPVGFADGHRDYGMIRDRSAVLRPNAAVVLVAAGYPDRQLGSGGAEVGYLEGGRTMSCEVEMAVDGSCLGNPGPGGWACILRYGESERVLQGGVPQATNNRIEMTAAIEGLRALKRPCEVRVFTDSEYLLRGMTQFLERWQSNGWRSASGNGVANQDLWEALAELASYHRVTWVHVGGHSGHSDQERCDRLAARAAREARQSLTMEASVGR